MNKFFKAYLNWRANVLAIMAMIAFLLIVSENESLLLFVLDKIAGFILGYLTFRLGKYWNSKGKIDELMELAEEE